MMKSTYPFVRYVTHSKSTGFPVGVLNAYLAHAMDMWCLADRKVNALSFPDRSDTSLVTLEGRKA